MTIWIDAQLSPAIATWITSTFEITTTPLRDLGLRDAEDKDIFIAAKSADVIVMTKDADFPQLLATFGAPPKIIWLTCGNTSNKNLKTILLTTLKPALELLESGESLIEISGL